MVIFSQYVKNLRNKKLFSKVEYTTKYTIFLIIFEKFNKPEIFRVSNCLSTVSFKFCFKSLKITIKFIFYSDLNPLKDKKKSCSTLFQSCLGIILELGLKNSPFGVFFDSYVGIIIFTQNKETLGLWVNF